MLPAPAGPSQSKPLRMSVRPVASQTRTPLGTGIIGALLGCRAPPRWWPDQPDPRSAPVPQPTPPRPRRRRPPLVGVASQREKAAQAGQRPGSGGRSADCSCCRRSRRHRNRRLGVIPCRRATEEIELVVRRASSTMARFSQAAQDRRVLATTVCAKALGPDMSTIQVYPTDPYRSHPHPSPTRRPRPDAYTRAAQRFTASHSSRCAEEPPFERHRPLSGGRRCWCRPQRSSQAGPRAPGPRAAASPRHPGAPSG